MKEQSLEDKIAELTALVDKLTTVSDNHLINTIDQAAIMIQNQRILVKLKRGMT
jgi:hypothetical protein